MTLSLFVLCHSWIWKELNLNMINIFYQHNLILQISTQSSWIIHKFKHMQVLQIKWIIHSKFLFFLNINTYFLSLIIFFLFIFFFSINHFTCCSLSIIIITDSFINFINFIAVFSICSFFSKIYFRCNIYVNVKFFFILNQLWVTEVENLFCSNNLIFFSFYRISNFLFYRINFNFIFLILNLSFLGLFNNEWSFINIYTHFTELNYNFTWLRLG